MTEKGFNKCTECGDDIGAVVVFCQLAKMGKLKKVADTNEVDIRNVDNFPEFDTTIGDILEMLQFPKTQMCCRAHLIGFMGSINTKLH